jgi:hypothetical protein
MIQACRAEHRDRPTAQSDEGQQFRRTGMVLVPTCRCGGLRRLDGEEAQPYAVEHLRLIERGREPTGAEDYPCDQTFSSWVPDYPLRHWADDGRGRPRLRKLPLAHDDPPAGALD